MSGNALTVAAGLSRNTVFCVERGRPGVTIATFFAIADALGVRRAWLVSGEEPMEINETDPDKPSPHRTPM